MTENEKQIIEAAQAIIEREKTEKQLQEQSSDIVENDKLANDNTDDGPNGLAIASMIVGIASFFIYPIITGIIALVLSTIVLELNKKKSQKKGNGMALTGMITGICAIMICLFQLLVLKQMYTSLW